MPEIQLSQGTIEYSDTGGRGPVVVLFGGLAIGPTLWSEVVAELSADHRCIVPTLPWGSHKIAMNADADLTLRGHAKIVAELLERLDLHDVTLVENDSGMAQVLAGEGLERVARLVITSGEAFDNYPPGLPGKMVSVLAHLPGGAAAVLQPLRIKALRRLPIFYGWMAKKVIPDDQIDEWLAPLFSDKGVQRDLTKYLRSVDKKALLDAAEKFPSFEKPVLVAWAKDDKVMPPAHGKKMASLFPNARLVEIEDSYTLIPIDQPQKLATEIRSFVRA